MTEPSPAPTSSRYAWYVVGVLTLANVLGFVDRQILSLLVIPIRRDLGLSLTEMSYLIGLPFAIFFTFMTLPLGRLADVSNRRNIIAVGVALWSLMTALSGLAGSFGRLLLARIGVGVGEATLGPSGTSLMADLFPRERLGTAMGVYSTGIFLGSGLAYFIGGWIVGLVSDQQVWTLPLVGAVRPWQTVFFIVGLPGLIVAALFLTVREPRRAEPPSTSRPFTELFQWVRTHARAYGGIAFGFAMYATANFGIAAWLATFLVQRYGIEISRAGMIQGVLTMSLGTLGVVGGGRLMDAWSRRGYVDSPVLVGITGATGMLVFATAYPLMPSLTAAVACLALVNVFAALPWGAALAAGAAMVPPRMRGQSTALVTTIVNFVSLLLGPWSVAAITDGVFHSDAALGRSLAIVNAAAMLLAIALFLYGRSAFRRVIAAVGALPHDTP